MNKKLIAIGIAGTFALVLLVVNYLAMYPISQQQLEKFKREATRYGWYGEYGEGYPWNMRGVQYSYDLQRLYDAYQTTMNEIYLVSAVCAVIALSSFYYVGYEYLRGYRKFKQTKLADAHVRQENM